MNLRWIYPLLTIAAVIIVWQLAVGIFHIPKYLLPEPLAVVGAARDNMAALTSNTEATTVETLIGFALSIAIGIPLAVAIVYSRIFERMVYPLIISSQAVPKIAIAPLLLVWFGFGDVPKILVALLTAFFPVVISAVVGFESAEREMLQLVRSMGGSQWKAFTKVRFPNALPSIFGGLKVAITLAVVGAVVGEFVGSNTGLGYLLLVTAGNLNTSLMFADIVVLTVLGLVLFYIIDIIEHLATPWYERSRIDDVAVVTL